MPSDKKVRVAIVGLGFGAEFIPIYQAHPNADMYAVCRRNKGELDKTADKYGIKARYTSYEELLKDPNVDAVHINSPIPDHAPQSIAALKAGKHVACTVPMATTVDECKALVEARRAGPGVGAVLDFQMAGHGMRPTTTITLSATHVRSQPSASLLLNP